MELMKDRDDAAGVRLSVRRSRIESSLFLLFILTIDSCIIILIGGCNGYSYTMNYLSKQDVGASKDERLEAKGVKVFIDPKAIFFLVGTEMDYEVIDFRRNTICWVNYFLHIRKLSYHQNLLSTIPIRKGNAAVEKVLTYNIIWHKS